jgi:hypothetical protein
LLRKSSPAEKLLYTGERSAYCECIYWYKGKRERERKKQTNKQRKKEKEEVKNCKKRQKLHRVEKGGRNEINVFY